MSQYPNVKSRKNEAQVQAKAQLGGGMRPQTSKGWSGGRSYVMAQSVTLVANQSHFAREGEGTKASLRTVLYAYIGKTQPLGSLHSAPPHPPAARGKSKAS